MYLVYAPHFIDVKRILWTNVYLLYITKQIGALDIAIVQGDYTQIVINVDEALFCQITVFSTNSVITQPP